MLGYIVKTCYEDQFNTMYQLLIKLSNLCESFIKCNLVEMKGQITIVIIIAIEFVSLRRITKSISVWTQKLLCKVTAYRIIDSCGKREILRTS